jgi:hypothetical protein
LLFGAGRGVSGLRPKQAKKVTIYGFTGEKRQKSGKLPRFSEVVSYYVALKSGISVEKAVLHTLLNLQPSPFL